MARGRSSLITIERLINHELRTFLWQTFRMGPTTMWLLLAVAMVLLRGMVTAERQRDTNEDYGGSGGDLGGGGDYSYGELSCRHTRLVGVFRQPIFVRICLFTDFFKRIFFFFFLQRVHLHFEFLNTFFLL